MKNRFVFFLALIVFFMVPSKIMAALGFGIKGSVNYANMGSAYNVVNEIKSAVSSPFGFGTSFGIWGRIDIPTLFYIQPEVDINYYNSEYEFKNLGDLYKNSLHNINLGLSFIVGKSFSFFDSFIGLSSDIPAYSVSNFETLSVSSVADSFKSSLSKNYNLSVIGGVGLNFSKIMIQLRGSYGFVNSKSNIESKNNSSNNDSKLLFEPEKIDFSIVFLYSLI